MQQDEWAPETIEECLNLDDIESLATRNMNRKAWGYYYSAAILARLFPVDDMRMLTVD